ncbi:MAG: FAD-binding oxidoreductase [Vulcanimicrobiaceae bacterium]
MSSQGTVDRLKPRTVDELRDAVTHCDREGLKIAVTGGGTLAGVGLPGVPADVNVSTTMLYRPIAYHPGDLTVAVQAGMKLRSLANLLGKERQFVPLDAPRPGEATVGGTLAANWLGPRRHLYGRPRDFVIGSQIVLADGTVANAGGMVVKNVAGYDLSRLYVGSFGTLGILSRVNLKTLPAPAKMRAFLASVPEGARARAIEHLRQTFPAPSAAFWVNGFRNAIDGEDGDEGRLVVLLEGSEALVERATRDLRSTLGRAGVPGASVLESGARESFERVVDAYISTVGERSITYRLLASEDRAEERAMEMQRLAFRFEFKADLILVAMNGDVVMRVVDLDARSLGAKIEMFDDALHDLEPRVAVIAGDHPSHATLNAWGEPPPAIERMRALKRRFDPNGTLNPGRLAGGI